MKIHRFTWLLAFIFFFSSLSVAQEFSLITDSTLPEEFTPSEYKRPVTEPDFIKPEKRAPINQAKTKITIKSNVANASVYLNGQFQGTTTLILNNLAEGHYRLRIEKSGYEPKSFRLTVRRGQSESFYVELKKYQGILNFNGKPENAAIYLDGSKIKSSSVIADEGKHNIEIKKFGYVTLSKKVDVYRDSSQTINFSLKEAEFEITGFSADKKCFNPSLSGTPGQLKFTIYVTNRQKAEITIYNQFHHVVLTRTLPEFTTWEQSWEWDGKNDFGQPLINGEYTVVLTAGQKEKQVTFTADDSITIPSASITAGGSGIGSLPQAFTYPEGSFVAGFSGGAVFSDTDKKFYCAPLTASLLFAFSSVELSARAGLLAGHEKASPFYSAALKICGQEKSSDFKLHYGVMFRIGGARNKPFEPYGADTGSGAGGGILLGLDFTNIYTGFSSELTYGTSSFAGTSYDTVWKNGLTVQYKTGNYAAALYGALHSSFGTTELELDKRTKEQKNWTRAVEGGIDLSFNPEQSTVYYNLRASTIIFSDKKYFKAEAAVKKLL